MNTVTFTTPEGKKRYYLADGSGAPVPEVMDYLKFLDNQGVGRRIDGGGYGELLEA